MTTLEQIKAAVQTLPPADRRGLRQWMQEQEQLDRQTQSPVEPTAQPINGATATPCSKETVEQQIERFRKAMKWIDEHRAEYLGQWVVLVGDRLISHGFNGHQVADEAKAAGIEVPFITQVLEEPEAVLWTL